MRRVVLALIALSVTAAFAASEPAEKPVKKKKSYVRTYATHVRRVGDSGYYERLADKLPYGTKRWWHQMDHENRGGR